uniref:Uncharacterized protein n=1 Tax=Arion vulgaris TaxID=1028688 RepID=A0A0B7A1W3_9EUPU
MVKIPGTGTNVEPKVFNSQKVNHKDAMQLLLFIKFSSSLSSLVKVKHVKRNNVVLQNSDPAMFRPRFIYQANYTKQAKKTKPSKKTKPAKNTKNTKQTKKLRLLIHSDLSSVLQLKPQPL